MTPPKKINLTNFVSLQHHHVVRQPWRFGETLKIWLEMGITVGCMAWELLLLYCMRKCMKIAVLVCVWELYENWCCCVEPESVVIVLYCCNTRREPTLKHSQMKHFLNKLRRQRKRKKEVYHMIPKFASTESDNNPTIPNNNKSTSHSLQEILIMKFIHQSAENPGL